jgi:hypothetical protein
MSPSVPTTVPFPHSALPSKGLDLDRDVHCQSSQQLATCMFALTTTVYRDGRAEHLLESFIEYSMEKQVVETSHPSLMHSCQY